MQIDFICTDPKHPINPVLCDWLEKSSNTHILRLSRKKSELTGGDILFLISCHEYIGLEIRQCYRNTLILHASELPIGRGWSPHVWTILNGGKEIVVTLLEAEDKIDSGDIWAQRRIMLEGHELSDEINELLFQAEIELIEYAIDNYTDIKKRSQNDSQATYFKRRTPLDSRIHPEKNIASQFDLLRVVDNERYPAFFDFRGHRYYLKIYKEPIDG